MRSIIKVNLINTDILITACKSKVFIKIILICQQSCQNLAIIRALNNMDVVENNKQGIKNDLEW